MKIATYNLRCGGKAGQRVHWTQIFEVANPDIFLVQETCHPQQYVTSRFWEVNSNQVQWAKVGNNAWGSAVFVRSGSVNKIEVPQFEGNVVGVEVEGFAWSPTQTKKLRVISIHAPAPYKPSVNRILDWLATLPDDADLIIGGDFNLTVGVRHPGEQQQDQDLWLLERLQKEFGLMSCCRQRTRTVILCKHCAGAVTRRHLITVMASSFRLLGIAIWISVRCWHLHCGRS